MLKHFGEKSQKCTYWHFFLCLVSDRSSPPLKFRQLLSYVCWKAWHSEKQRAKQSWLLNFESLGSQGNRKDWCERTTEQMGGGGQPRCWTSKTSCLLRQNKASHIGRRRASLKGSKGNREWAPGLCPIVSLSVWSLGGQQDPRWNGISGLVDLRQRHDVSLHQQGAGEKSSRGTRKWQRQGRVRAASSSVYTGQTGFINEWIQAGCITGSVGDGGESQEGMPGLKRQPLHRSSRSLLHWNVCPEPSAPDS